MTSNIGSDIIQENYVGVESEYLAGVYTTTKEQVILRLQHSVRPEFLNRIDEVTMFEPLTRSNLKEIALLQIENLKERLALQEISMSISEKALDMIADEGYDPQYGARPIKRLIQRDIVNLLSKKLLGNEIRSGSSFTVDVENGELIIKTDLVNQVFLN